MTHDHVSCSLPSKSRERAEVQSSVVVKRDKLLHRLRAYQTVNSFLPIDFCSVPATSSPLLHTNSMSSMAVLRIAARTSFAPRASRTLSIRAPTTSSLAKNSRRSFAVSAARAADHDAHDPHGEESFEEFTARYLFPPTPLCGLNGCLARDIPTLERTVRH